MTSANVIEYTIRDANDNVVGEGRQNLLCKPHWGDLLKFRPLEDYTIRVCGYDEDDEYWENDPVSLRAFLSNKVQC